MLLLLKFLTSNAAKNLLVKNVEHKLEYIFSDGIKGDVHPRHLILLSVQISHLSTVSQTYRSLLL